MSREPWYWLSLKICPHRQGASRSWPRCGGADGTRTRDLRVDSPALSQLSYSPCLIGLAQCVGASAVLSRASCSRNHQSDCSQFGPKEKAPRGAFGNAGLSDRSMPIGGRRVNRYATRFLYGPRFIGTARSAFSSRPTTLEPGLGKVRVAERGAVRLWTPPGGGYRNGLIRSEAVPISLAAALAHPFRGVTGLNVPNRYSEIGRPVRSLSLWRVRTNFRSEPAFGLKPPRGLEPKWRALLLSPVRPSSRGRLTRRAIDLDATTGFVASVRKSLAIIEGRG